MKFLPAQLSYLLGQGETRSNLAALLRYLAVLLASIAVYSVLFHVIMLYEGQRHSWLTGLYWTLTVMSTLGFGDITFQSDLGRGFSIVVLLSGIVMLLIVLPFTFIRFFYAPWLEAQVRLRAPRQVPEGTRGHVVLCRADEVGRELMARLARAGTPCWAVERDPAVAAALHADGLRVVAGDPASAATWEALRIRAARAVLANLSDAENANVALTVRELAQDLPVVALAEQEHSVDVLELSGATHVLPLKYRLGEHLASRVTVGTPQTHRLGTFGELVIAEFPIHQTRLPGRTIRQTRLREVTGLNVVAVWERGKLLHGGPDTLLSEHSVPVIVGTDEQLSQLDAFFAIYQSNENPVVVIGGGKVGRAAAQALRRREVPVTIVDRELGLEARLAEAADRVVLGDAADLGVVTKAGVSRAPSVVLTTNDDATNIFLTLYCRRLNPTAHVVSRITHEWNREAVHRAGANFALSYTSLAVQSALALLLGHELVVIGEGVEVFVEPVTPPLEGRTLGESGIGARTGLNVIALREDDETCTNPGADTRLRAGARLVMIGSTDQHERFRKLYPGRRAG